MMKEAIRQLNEWQVERINEYCNVLIQKPLRIFHKLGCIVESLEYTSPHLIGVRVGKHMDFNKIKNALEENRIKVSIRGNSIRISTNVYNDRQDFER